MGTNNVSTISDQDLLKEIGRRFEEKEASIQEMEFMTKKLLDLNEKTKKAEEVKSQFLSLIKNEFNNPISTLLSASGRLAQGRNLDKAPTMHRMMHMELLRLDFQLQNIFSASEIEAGEIGNDFSKLNLQGLYEDVLKTFSYQIEDKNLTPEIYIQTNSHFVSDNNKVTMILKNLLSNAIEFSYPNEVFRITFSERDEHFILEVYNRGETIQVDEKAKVYNRFVHFNRGEARAQSGLGLGLSVVRGFIEALDGDVDYFSEENRTTFTVSFPKITEADTTSLGGNDVMFEDFESNDGEDEFFEM